MEQLLQYIMWKFLLDKWVVMQKTLMDKMFVNVSYPLNRGQKFLRSLGINIGNGEIFLLAKISTITITRYPFSPLTVNYYSKIARKQGYRVA